MPIFTLDSVKKIFSGKEPTEEELATLKKEVMFMNPAFLVVPEAYERDLKRQILK